MSIFERTLRCLEWDKVKEYLANQAYTVCGKQFCLNVDLAEDTQFIQELLEETDEALRLIESRSSLSQEGLPDIRSVMERMDIDAELSASEMSEVRTALKLTRLNKSVLSKLAVETFPKLTGFISRLQVVEPLIVSIDKILNEQGEIREDASADLLRLTSQANKIERQIREELNKVISSAVLSKALQEPIFTQRNDRYVLPVAANLRNTISGIVHGSSASGLTIYVEPTVVVELSNILRLKQEEIEREKARILSVLSSNCADHLVEISSSYFALIELDVIMAKGRLAQKYNGVMPAISTDGSMNLISAKHPLLMLQGLTSNVVANDIVLNKSTRTLVITGPNTGGKTVYLKTAGLLSLMIRAGLLIPVGAQSKAMVFSGIYSDIGDEQSLEQSLSTFSSHMTNIVEIISKAKSGCLILLDEIGAGTDPREGAALARAILEHLNESGAYTITSTHFGELKTLAYTVPGFLNASLEFDDETLSPTYKLKVGIPGSSKATTMAARLGLNQKVVEYANNLLSKESLNAQQLIDKLEEKLKNVDLQESLAKELWEKAQQLEIETKLQADQMAVREVQIRNEFAQKIEEEFKLAKQTLRELISQLQKDPSSKRAQQSQKEIEELRDNLSWLTPPLVANETVCLTVGQAVKILSLNQTAIVEELPTEMRKDGKIAVRAGNMRIMVSAADLVVVPFAKSMGSYPKTQRQQYDLATNRNAKVFVRTGSNTLDLRGQRVDEALTNLEKFLDEALVSTISPLMIIHGHGTGAVKNAVRNYLDDCSYVQVFRPGETQEGGDGVSVVEL